MRPSCCTQIGCVIELSAIRYILLQTFNRNLLRHKLFILFFTYDCFCKTRMLFLL
uniref:Uncharacterized protein n=1 Tax=Anticarsia gemmatalis multiple nucleopolyhedrovirus TaxID=268591 RepID=A0A0S3J1S9_9ABAC|nr:hypothetical protein AGNV_079 [Anticarsia gemmatalis multiple nucleopolyhedrovirus]